MSEDNGSSSLPSDGTEHLPALLHEEGPSMHILEPEQKSGWDGQAENGREPLLSSQESSNAGSPTTPPNHPVLIIVMGVSGSGKSTLGKALADSIGLAFVDADKLHPKANIDKMSAGTPLTDEDRKPWLELVRTTAEHLCAEQDSKPDYRGRRGVVIGCSALKKRYREILRGEESPAALPEHLEPPHPSLLPTYFVFIKGEREELMKRMEHREGHFMKATMLDSQLSTLESPEGEDGVVVVDLLDDTPTQVETAKEGLQKLAGEL